MPTELQQATEQVREHLSIYDATLRDGEQREGITMTVEDKLRIATCLDRLGVDYVEGGYPGSNPKDIEFFSRVKDLGLTHAKVTAFGSTRRKGIAPGDDENLRALANSGCEIATIVGKAWDEQVVRALLTELPENIRMVRESCAWLKEQGMGVFFDAEHFFDGYKRNPSYAMEVLAAAVEGGADCLVLCETNGGCLPFEVYRITSAVIERFPSVQVGIHTHDDSGCAVANALEAVRAGARQVQGCANGYGERVGNCNLMTLIPNAELKMGFSVLGAEKLATLKMASRFVAETVNLTLDTHAPYVGDSAFAHKGGLHASAIARMPESYEHVHPELVGNLTRVVMSELAGRASMVSKAKALGFDLSDNPGLAAEVLAEVKERENAGYSYEAADASLSLLIRERVGGSVSHFALESFRVIADKREDGKVVTEATVKVLVNDERFIATAEGDGPVSALDHALRQVITSAYPGVEKIELTDYKVRILNERSGTDATTRVLIESGDGEGSWGTVGVSTNIIEASWDALLASIEYGLLRQEV